MARTKKEAATEKRFAKPTVKQFDVIIRPVITEKTMAMAQNQNKIVVEVLKTASRTEIKLAFESVFQVKVKEVNIINVHSKAAKRGTRYPGTVSGYKKAVVTLAEGEALDLFKE
ncbi:MAG: 50S ribosomal protein L23 [Erysipelotrichales bacterium]|nr:50S ribosomal protein L23 [Erysipelotrichales bacterium]